MRFNAQKCYVLSTKPRSHFYYRLEGTIFRHVEQNSYIGIQISADLKWSTHITGLGKKAGSTLGFLRRNLWNCIEHQAARFITSDYRSREPGCIGKMLDFRDLQPLEERRRQLRMTMLYKKAKGLALVLPADAFLTAANRNRRTIRPTTYEGYETHNILQGQANNNSRCFKVPHSKTDQYRGLFFVKTVIEWNTLTNDIINLPTFNAFSSTVGRQRVALNG